MIRWTTALLVIFCCALSAHAQDKNTAESIEQSLEKPMSLERMEAILLALDPDAQTNGSRFLLTIEDVQVMVITDVINDRMRAMAPIRSTEGISSSEMTRMMQANFDSALDSRYAIAQGTLWSTYIHPFAPLQKNQLISGIGQVVNLALSYGTVYSGGGLNFGAGDSDGINRKLIEELLEKGNEA